MRSDEKIDHAVSVVLASPNASFTTLVRLAGLDPKRSFRHAPLQGIDFSRLDIRGYDFRGADLSGCTFVGTKILGANFDRATVEKASLKEAQDWKAYKDEQNKKAATASSTNNRDNDAPQISFEQAFLSFQALLRTGKGVKPETISAMVNVAPNYVDAARILQLSLHYDQTISPNAIRLFAKKISPRIRNSWLLKSISSNLNKYRERSENRADVFLAVEMSNLIGHLNDQLPEIAFNRMLTESRDLIECLSIVSFYEDRNWPISEWAVEAIESKIEDLTEIKEPNLPSGNLVTTVFMRTKSAFDFG